VKCCLVVNGVDIPTMKSDFLDRCLLFQLERIPDSKRKEESSLYTDFKDNKPIILGAMYKILSEAMGIYEHIKIDKLPRMADFAKWGCAISKAMGYDEKVFIRAYSENIKSVKQEIIKTYSLLETVISYMNLSDEDEIVETPTALCSILKKHAFSEGIDTTRFPTNATWLSRILIREAHILEEEGINVSTDKKGDRRIILRKLVSYRPKVTVINPATVVDNSCLWSPENMDKMKQLFVLN